MVALLESCCFNTIQSWDLNLSLNAMQPASRDIGQTFRFRTEADSILNC